MHKIFVRNSDYDYGRLGRDVQDILAALDGGVIKSGSKVLIKPNLICSARPGQAITTHPLVIRAAAEYAIDMGGRVQVSDSPATGSFDKIVRECGVAEALRGMPVSLKPLEASRKVETGEKFSTLELAVDALEADVIINLPKLKTHSQMALTLAVKNLFGCVVGMRKPEWHFRVGENKELFAQMLATIHKVLRPAINLMDGILAMEGDGPGTGGTPRRLDVLLGSGCAVALDTAICKMLSVNPPSLLTNRAAYKTGISGEFELVGALPLIEDFRIPDIRDLLFGPSFARGFLRRHVATRPASDPDICKYCNECVNICPAKAITNAGKKLRFDYDSCIRCYCCLEVCPHRAIKKRDTLVKKAIGRAAKLFIG